jgi:hypothetical protein
MADEHETQMWKGSLFGYISTWLELGIGGILAIGITQPGLPPQLFGVLILAFGIWNLTWVAHTVTCIDGHTFRFTSVRRSTTVEAAELVSMGSTGPMRRFDLWRIFPLSVTTLGGQVLVTAQLENLDDLRAAFILANPTVQMT